MVQYLKTMGTFLDILLIAYFSVFEFLAGLKSQKIIFRSILYPINSTRLKLCP